jgi:hypothetical protein
MRKSKDLRAAAPASGMGAGILPAPKPYGGLQYGKHLAHGGKLPARDELQLSKYTICVSKGM